MPGKRVNASSEATVEGSKRKKHRVDLRVISDNLQKEGCCSKNCMDRFRHRIFDVLEYRERYNKLGNRQDQQETLLRWVEQWNFCFEFLGEDVCKYVELYVKSGS